MGKCYGVLLIGCGHIGEEHIGEIYFRKNIKIYAVVDSVEERAKEFSDKYGAEHFGTDYRSFLNCPEVDIVIIATYANSHLSILKDCLAANKHVLCEKPITVTLEDGIKFCKVVKATDKKVLVAHILRHNHSYKKVAELIRDGSIGELKLMRMVQNHNAKDWSRYKRLMEDCPPIVDCGVHYLDVMQWFSNSKIVEVTGSACRIDPDISRKNWGMIAAKMANGCVGFYEAGWSQNIESQNTKDFIGDKGRISLTLMENRSRNREEGDLLTLYSSVTGEYKTINVDSKYKDMYEQLSVLIGMIENDEPACPTIDQVFSAFAAALAAKESAEKGLPVTL